MATKKEVVKTTKNEVAPASYDYGDQAGVGYEDMGAGDLSIPFVGVIQSNSKVITEEERAGAKAGMFLNTVTGIMTPGEAGIVFQPVHFDVMFVEQVPYDDGGGFIANHAVGSPYVEAAVKGNDGNRFGAIPCGENNKYELVETHYVYGNLMSEDGSEIEGFAVIPFRSMNIKPRKDWFTAMYMLKGKPPLFANRARLKTVKMTKNNNTFYVIKAHPLNEDWFKSLIPPTETGLLQAGMDFMEVVKSGSVTANWDAQNVGGEAKAGKGDPADPDKSPF